MVALATEIIGLVMDAETARQHVHMIQEHIARAEHHLGEARRLIYALKDGCGWKALGYVSWRQCVMAEFEQSSSTVYRQLDAALVEMGLSPNGGIGQINERVLRPLTARKYSAESRQLLWDISQELVGEGGKVTSGVVESVVDGLKDMLQSGTWQDADGEQHPLSEAIHADLVARVREKKIAHKEHIKRMDKKRDYLLGGQELTNVDWMPWTEPSTQTILTLELNTPERDRLYEATRKRKKIYISLWTEEE
jgi:hypothetical protein